MTKTKLKQVIETMLRDKMCSFAAITALIIFILFGIGPLLT